MDLDLDDLISSDTATKAGKKFQPKAKPKPKPKPKPNSQPEVTTSTQFVEVAPPTTEEHTENDVNQIIGNIIDSLQSEKSPEENAETPPTSDSPSDFLPESTTTVNLPPCSETPARDDVGPTESELISNIDASTNLESIAELDPLTGEEGAIFNNNEDFHIENLSSGAKEAENSLFWEHDITGSGPRVGKFKPKPKRKQNEPVSSIRTTDSAPAETISDNHMNEESISLTEISQMDLVNKASEALQVIDEAENEAIDDNNNNNDDDFVPQDESLVKKIKSKPKAKSKSKKPLDEDKKPARKRKKGKELSDELTEVPKKKFSHSTKRNKRPVNPELLKIPEEEFELHMHTFPLRDLIRLREHNERIEKKQASLVGTDESDLAQNATYYNYQTHMKITPRLKWTKQDTELFYEAIQQFGTDLSIIKECFPGRTREQMRSKFKKEYKQHRLRIESALNTRVKGHSHFEAVIERLKQARGEDSENEDPDALIGEEDEVQAAADNNEEDGVEKEVKDMKGGESPTEANDFEEDDDTWSQYKSEI